jgi:hypothetical protein
MQHGRYEPTFQKNMFHAPTGQRDCDTFRRKLKICLKFLVFILSGGGGARWRSWLRHCTTTRKVAGSILDIVIGIFHLYNPSSRTMAQGRPGIFWYSFLEAEPTPWHMELSDAPEKIPSDRGSISGPSD